MAYQQDDLWTSRATAYLPQQQGLLSGTDRAAVQELMLHRAQARSQIRAGCTQVQELAVVKNSTEVLSSPCGKYCATLQKEYDPFGKVDREIAVTSVQDGSLIWRRGASALLNEYCRLPGFAPAHRSAILFADCFYGVNYLIFSDLSRLDPDTVCIHFALVDAFTGAMSRVHALTLEDVVGSYDGFHMCHSTYTFSPRGDFLAVYIDLCESGDGPWTLDDKVFLIILDVATCAVRVQTELDTLFDRNSALDNDADSASWACGEGLLFWHGLLVHTLQGTKVVELEQDEELVERNNRAFDKTGSWLAFTVNFGMPSTRVFDVSDPTQPKRLLQIENHSFVQHFVTRRWALLHRKDNHTAQIWGLEDQKLVHIISLSTSTPQLALDDRILLGEAMLPSDVLQNSSTLSCWGRESKLCFWSIDPASGAISGTRLFLRGALKYLPDECRFVCIGCLSPGRSELYTVRLC